MIPAMVLPISVINLWPIGPQELKVSTAMGTKCCKILEGRS